MKVLPAYTQEYTQRHNPIWPELAEVLYGHGVRHYSIFLDEETYTLFGYAEIESEEQWATIADTEVCREWWDYMKDVMETNADNSPVITDLYEVFHFK